MYFTPTDTSERHAYVDHAISSSLEVLGNPDVVRQMGGSAVQFANILTRASVANIVNGEVQLPTDIDDEPYALPIVALHPDEQVVMSSAYDEQDTFQKKNTLREFKRWEPRQNTAGEIYEQFINGSVSRRNRPLVSMYDITVAMTGHIATLLSEQDLSSYFAKSPEKSIALVKSRPCLILKINDNETDAIVDVIIHELVHVKQSEERPVMTIHSQKSADMLALRMELEAYHAGSIAALHRYKRIVESQKGELHPENIDSGAGQISVENARTKNGIDPLDPYRPSPRLLRLIKEAPIGNILHGNISYDELLAMLETYV